MKIDEYIARYKEKELRRWKERIKADIAEWKRTHRKTSGVVIVKNGVSGEFERYVVESDEELIKLLDRIAARGPYQPFPILEFLPGLYFIGPFEVSVVWDYEVVDEDEV